MFLLPARVLAAAAARRRHRAVQDVKDNHEEAAKVAPQTLRLCQMVRAGARPHAPACVCGACVAALMRHLGLVRAHENAVRHTSCSACLGAHACVPAAGADILHACRWPTPCDGDLALW